MAERPRIFWGRVLKVLIEHGWNPPMPSTRATHAILDDMLSAIPYNSTLDLSPGQKRALLLVAQGHSRISAAETDGISPAVVKRQLAIARSKLGARTNAHAVAIAMSRGILRL